MKFLIDGYNLMYAAHITGAPGPGTSLHRSRHALLRELARMLEAAERAATTIVFDAQDAPAGLKRKTEFAEMEILFAPRDDEADDLIIELIRSVSHARGVTVVSSDHRIQAAARRRGATAVDSDQWYRARRRARRQSIRDAAHDNKPIPHITDQELDQWAEQWQRELGDLDVSNDNQSTNSHAPEPRKVQPTDHDDLANPFPPGYGEDLLDEDSG